MYSKIFEIITKFKNLPVQITWLIVFTIFLVKGLTFLDPDFGWHIKSGEYIFHNSLPSHDIFTYKAENFPWIGHEWLADVIFYLAFSIGGLTLSSILFAFIWTLAVKLSAGEANRYIIIIASLVLSLYAGVRAMTWSVFGVATLIFLLRKDNKKFFASIPLLFALWSNLHGSFVVGFMIIGYHAILKKSKYLWLILITSILATFINPYGWNVYIEILRTLTDTSLRWNISEWGILSIEILMIPYLAIWGSSYFYVNKKGLKRFFTLDFALFVAAIMSNRMLPIFVIYTLFGTALRISKIKDQLPKKLDKKREKIIVIYVTTAVIFICYSVFDYYRNSSFDTESAYPQAAVQYLHDNPCGGNIFNYYDYGGYLIWKLPESKVYIDGRMPSWTFNGEKYIETYKKILSDKATRTAEFSKYHIKCVVLPKKENTSKLIKDLSGEGWNTAIDDNSSILLTR